MSPDGSYHGIIVRESLHDPSVLDKFELLGSAQGEHWTLHRVGVTKEAFPILVDLVRRNLKVENGVPFYAHFYNREELVVVFPKRIFHVTPKMSSWAPVLTYALSAGIPAEQLDFKPCRVEDETY
jgi:hypothetical protein